MTESVLVSAGIVEVNAQDARSDGKQSRTVRTSSKWRLSTSSLLRRVNSARSLRNSRSYFLSKVRWSASSLTTAWFLMFLALATHGKQPDKHLVIGIHTSTAYAMVVHTHATYGIMQCCLWWNPGVWKTASNAWRFCCKVTHLLANFKVDRLSAKASMAGLIMHIIVVLQLPPKLSSSMRVSLLSRYGMWARSCVA